MPGENWRWRMLGAALHVVDAIPPLDGYDGIIVTDLFNLADFKALVRQPCPPVLAYFHENQITYPQPPGGVLDNPVGANRSKCSSLPGISQRGPV